MCLEISKGPTMAPASRKRGSPVLRILVPGLRLHAICDWTSTVSLHWQRQATRALEYVRRRCRYTKYHFKFVTESAEARPSDADGAESDHAPGGRVLVCVHECIVREGVGTASKQLGVLERGVTITMLESRTADDGVERVRFDAGWASVASSTGQTVFLLRILNPES